VGDASSLEKKLLSHGISTRGLSLEKRLLSTSSGEHLKVATLIGGSTLIMD